MSGPLPLRKALPLAIAAGLALVAFAAEAEVDVAVGERPELGDVLVDGSGRTLYVFTADSDGTSTCYDDCAATWPPLLSDGDLTAGPGIDPALLGTTARQDGTEQVTFGGRPLYTYVGDAQAGDTNGHGLDDAWYAVAPDGSPLGGAVGGDDVAALMQEGADVFARICSACHGANGDQALAEHVAILADNSRLATTNRVLRRIIHGGGYMPGFGHLLSDREVAAVATFIRDSWGNDYGPVSEEEAANMR